MQVLTVLEPTAPVLTPDNRRPQEDYLMISDRFPIFVVVDGVTLERSSDGKYPNPSGAGELAKIFCERVLVEAEKRYDNLSLNDLMEIFRIGNKAAGEYNLSQGRTKETSNFSDFDLFAATTALAIIRDNHLHWWSLCDAGVSVFNDRGERVFVSPECWPERHRYLPPNWGDLPREERNRTIRRRYRNGVNERGELIGYGVVTGEPAAEKYLKIGSRQLMKGDMVVVYTDGFEPYLARPDFISLLMDSAENREEKIGEFSRRQILDDPATFGHERSLIAIGLCYNPRL